jgi:hypothetical protein
VIDGAIQVHGSLGFSGDLPWPVGVAWNAARVRVGPVDALVGRWIPADGSGGGALRPPFVELAADGTYTGSDGANGTSGQWTTGPDGGLDVTLGPSTRMAGPDMVPVPTWFADATRARFDGDVLVLLGSDGAEAGRLRRA